MAIAEITIIPVGTATTSLSSYVASIQRLLQQEAGISGISYEMTAMSTIIEGELDQLFRLLRLMHEIPFGEGAQRVCTSVKFDDRRDRHGSIQQKLQSVAQRLEPAGIQPDAHLPDPQIPPQ